LRGRWITKKRPAKGRFFVALVLSPLETECDVLIQVHLQEAL